MAQGTKNVVEVSLAGIPLKLKSGKDPEAIKKLVSYVDKKIKEALPATKNGSVQNAALLAALNMVEELFELKTKAIAQLEKFEKKALKVVDDLDRLKTPRQNLDI